MTFIRFVLSTPHPVSGVNDGLFRLAYELRRVAGPDLAQREALLNSLAWFDEHLPTPDRFNRSKSKGYYRRNTRGIAWFRASAIECVARMHELKRALEANGYPVSIIREERVGYIVYEDNFQVVAEPFSDTETGQ